MRVIGLDRATDDLKIGVACGDDEAGMLRVLGAELWPASMAHCRRIQSSPCRFPQTSLQEGADIGIQKSPFRPRLIRPFHTLNDGRSENAPSLLVLPSS